MCSAYRRPFTTTVPLVGASSPMIIRMVVDLPAPFGPRNPVTVPGLTVKSSRSTAVVSPYRFVSWCASIIRVVPSITGAGSPGASVTTLGTAGRPIRGTAD